MRATTTAISYPPHRSTCSSISTTYLMAPLTPFSLSLITLLGLLSSGGTLTTFTIKNKCEHTVWPGVLTIYNKPLATTGFALEKGETKSLTAPEGWGGLFWGRTLCSNDSTENFSCVTGDCGSGEVECSGNGAIPPATLAEFKLGSSGSPDFFDVSLVDGFNLPMLVVPQGNSGNSSCPSTGCVTDLYYACPSELKVTSLNGSEGVGCTSACEAFNEPQYCCTGAYDTPDTCQPTSYSKAFKYACPHAYTYPYDNTTFTCNTADNYAIIFCPTLNTSLVWNKLHSGENLNKSSLMFSAGGDYSLGFKFNSSYLTQSLIPAGIPVWIANLDNPISDPSSALLTLDKTPILLQITHRGGNPIVLYSSPENLAEDMELVVTLSTSGNLVLEKGKKDAFGDTEEPSEVATEFRATSTPTRTVLWQSFDHPNAALRPGMKLGVDHLSRQNCSLSSLEWNSSTSVAPGFFSLEWNAAGHQLEIKRSGVVYWTSGEFRNRTFKFINIPPDSYNFSVVSNEREDSFSYSANYQGSRKISLWVLDTAGKLYDISHNISIAKLDNCDGYNNRGGCQRWGNRSTDCPPHQSGNDDFQLMENGSFRPKDLVTSTRSSWLDSNQSRSGIDNCKATCWKDCDCLGFDFLSDNQTSTCRYWSVKYSHFLFSEVGNESATSATSFVIPGLIQIKPSRRKIDKWIWVVTAIAAVLLAVTLCIVIWFLLQRRKLAGENRRNIQDILEKMEKNRPTRANGIQTKGDVKHDISVFSYASIIAATRNFSDDNKLGQGGFGPVYKGKMVTGQEIAVKRLSKLSSQGALEFQNELILIYELQHKNLVQLFGFCIHGDERMLIYEYLPNKSLDYFLFDSTRGQQLDWIKRFSIIEGIAQGLLYLHKYSRMTVIHRDLKASNVLLDGNMNPKISDFGMSRIFAHEEQEAHTRRIVGTKGYMSPEYVMGGNFSMKFDVYSFGVLMLEILSGRRNNSFYNDDRAFNLVDYAWMLRREGAELGLMDPTIWDSCIKEQLLRCIHVGLLCVEESAANRPTMLDAISMLTTENMSLPEPVKPAFCAERNLITAGIDGNQPEIPISVNGMSNSDFVGR